MKREERTDDRRDKLKDNHIDIPTEDDRDESQLTGRKAAE